MQGIG